MTHPIGCAFLEFASSLKPIFGQFADLFTVLIVWLYAYILTISGAHKDARPTTQLHCRVDRSGHILGVPWYFGRVPYPFHWGAPSFDAGEAFAMTMTYIYNSCGDNRSFHCCFKVCKADMIPASIISRGIGWQCMSILIDSFLDGQWNLSFSCEFGIRRENIGLLALPPVGSRRL